MLIAMRMGDVDNQSDLGKEVFKRENLSVGIGKRKGPMNPVTLHPGKRLIETSMRRVKYMEQNTQLPEELEWEGDASARQNGEKVTHILLNIPLAKSD